MATELVFGIDIGTTSIGSTVLTLDRDAGHGELHHLGVRIFPEARDEKHLPLNHTRRQKRLARRQLRRRRVRRRTLNELLATQGLLPAFGAQRDSAWRAAMAIDPWPLYAAAETRALTAVELGRLLYHVAQRRHFQGRALQGDGGAGPGDSETAEERQAQSQRERDRAALRAAGTNIGAFLSAIPDGERRRGRHFAREDVRAQFVTIIAAQRLRHPVLADPVILGALTEAIFSQRPVFWRRGTLGRCRLVPGAMPAATASWLAQEKRMLEKLNDLIVEVGNGRPLDTAERHAVIALLRRQDSVTWGALRKALRLPPSNRFNLERGGEKGLTGNRLENRMAAIVGARWDSDAALRDSLRADLHRRLFAADYAEIGERIVIRDTASAARERAALADNLARDFALPVAAATALADIQQAGGWTPFSEAALAAMLPRLAAGARFGALLNGPEEEGWRDRTFPARERPTGALVRTLPSPADRDEQARLGAIRNPTVVRVQNELRKVVNNLIRAYGAPHRIRVEVGRDVGRSAREREEITTRTRKREAERRRAAADLVAQGIAVQSGRDIEKWLLWQECRRTCPFTGRAIGFEALFRTGEFQVEHIWPRERSLDDSFANKTLCHVDANRRKGNRTPAEAFDAADLAAMVERVRSFAGPPGLIAAKARRFIQPIPDDFASRQLNDTRHAALQVVTQLKMLFPDVGPTAEVRVQVVTGQVTARLRRHWGLADLLGDGDSKTRDDHRHHAVDALVVAAAHPGYGAALSRYFAARDSGVLEPQLPLPFPDIRAQAQAKLATLVVSHRVRRKLSGPLHKETVYGDAGPARGSGGKEYRYFVTRKPVAALTPSLLKDDEAWPDAHIRDTLRHWLAAHDGDIKKALTSGLPTVSTGGPEIRRVRVRVKQQAKLMATLKNGHADLGNNHHVAIYRDATGVHTEVVSLFEAAQRQARHEPVVRRQRPDGATFVMALSPGEIIHFAAGTRQGLWVVKGVWAAGPIILWRAADARGVSVWRPVAATILGDGGVKVQVDPIGRTRPAHD
ncbi:hypothetical protein IP88_01355 [alpha proteobacterium AAP81b]|nr:hypothetical protein IP88_01355 [alpha proteobacterium AAP81b]